MVYNDYILKEIKDRSISIIGFADLSQINPISRYNFKYGISIAMAVNPEIISRIPTGPHYEYYEEVERVSKNLKETSLYLEKVIIEKGFNAYSLARVKQDEQYRTPLPFKTIATRAGIGWIGKCATLVNSKYGNAIRLNAVLTDMPFSTGEPINESRCGSCKECVINCPAKAVQGKQWDISIDRDSLLNPYLCKDNVIERGKKFDITVNSCGICIAVCPFTKKYINENLHKRV